MKKRWLSLIMAMILMIVPTASVMAEEAQILEITGAGAETVQSGTAEKAVQTLTAAEAEGAGIDNSGTFSAESFGEDTEGSATSGISEGKLTDDAPDGILEEKLTDDVLDGISEEKVTDDAPDEISEEKLTDDALQGSIGEKLTDDAPDRISKEDPDEEAPDEAASEMGDFQGFDAGDFLIEDICEAEALETLEYGADEAEELTEEITGTLQRNSQASDAIQRQYGRYSYLPSQYWGNYGVQLTGEAWNIYLEMKSYYVDQRKSDNLEISFNSNQNFCTSGTVIGGKLYWDREHNAQYQEVSLNIEYALQSAFDALVYDYPEVFWMSEPDYSYQINYTYANKLYVGTISSVTFMPTSAEEYPGASSEIAAFHAAVTRVKNSITAGNTREETVRAIHDYLCNNYFYNDNDYAHSAGGVFLHGSAGIVCEGYAKAFKILCNKFDIPCILVVGDAGEAHMWNYVKMNDNNWYLVDVTWDDNPYGAPDYDYFLVGSNSPSILGSSQKVGDERLLYTNFSQADYTQNFVYPCLSADAYTAGQHEHTWQIDTQLKPTCTAIGLYVYKCSCGAKTYEWVEATGHSYREKKYIYNNDATCLQDGTKTAVCDNGCGTTRQTVYAVGTKLKATISFNASSLKLKTKQSTSKFRVTYGKGDYVASWKSSNKKIVKVTGRADGTCTIKAQKKAGSAKITVTLASGLKKSFTVKVQKAAVKTTKISGIPKTLAMGKGNSYTLQATVSPFTSKQKVTYKSSNKKVATVSKQGIIKARRKGKATITVQSGTKKVKCKVTVG